MNFIFSNQYSGAGHYSKVFLGDTISVGDNLIEIKDVLEVPSSKIAGFQHYRGDKLHIKVNGEDVFLEDKEKKEISPLLIIEILNLYVTTQVDDQGKWIEEYIESADIIISEVSILKGDGRHTIKEQDIIMADNGYKIKVQDIFTGYPVSVTKFSLLDSNGNFIKDFSLNPDVPSEETISLNNGEAILHVKLISNNILEIRSLVLQESESKSQPTQTNSYGNNFIIIGSIILAIGAVVIGFVVFRRR